MSAREKALERTIAINEALQADYYAPPNEDPLRAVSIDGHSRVRVGHGKERVVIQISGRGRGSGAIVVDPETARMLARRLELQADEADDIAPHSHDSHVRISLADEQLDI